MWNAEFEEKCRMKEEFWNAECGLKNPKSPIRNLKYAEMRNERRILEFRIWNAESKRNADFRMRNLDLNPKSQIRNPKSPGLIRNLQSEIQNLLFESAI